MQPERFGRYEVVAEIGDGSMGRVYKARDPVVERFVAIKTIKSEYLTRDQAKEYLKRFRREAQAAGSLNHPNIVRIFDVGENHLVMEMLEGQTLQQLIREGGPMEPERARAILSPVADALDHAHASGIIHRDIKPANIMIQTGGQPKLMDFGVAHLDATVMTATGQILGSPSFMSPEQLLGENVTPRSDNYSLAVVAYEMLTGQSPFPGKTITAVIYRVMHEEAPSPRKLNASLPDRYDEIFAKALAKDPTKRYASATDFSSALDIRDIELSLDGLLDDEAPEAIGPAPDAGAGAASRSTSASVPGETPPDLIAEAPTLAGPAPATTAGSRPGARRHFWIGLGAVVILGSVFVVLSRSGSEPPAAPTADVSASPSADLETTAVADEVAPSPTSKRAARPRASAPPRQASVAAASPERAKPTPAPTTEASIVELGPDGTPPRRIEGSSARYPEAARRRHLEGSVTASMIVTEEGEPIEVTIVESAGAILDAAVLEAIQDSRFEPATKDGLKVRVRWVIRQTFKLKR